jgi:phage/plasmid-associated DNA primase
LEWQAKREVSVSMGRRQAVPIRLMSFVEGFPEKTRRAYDHKHQKERPGFLEYLNLEVKRLFH